MYRLISVIFILCFVIDAKAGANTSSSFSKKIITITVNEKGQSLIGRDTLTTEELTIELQKRLWKSFTGRGTTYDVIRLQFSGEVSSEIKNAVIKAIQLSQKNALTEISLDKHKKLFESLSHSQQRKIKKHFPVLFQTDYE